MTEKEDTVGEFDTFDFEEPPVAEEEKKEPEPEPVKEPEPTPKAKTKMVVKKTKAKAKAKAKPKAKAKAKAKPKAKKKTKKQLQAEEMEANAAKPEIIEVVEVSDDGEKKVVEEINHAERAHALLAPSSGKYWMNCHGQPKAIKDAIEQGLIPEDGGTNPAAQWGTDCHEESEKRIIEVLSEQPMTPYSAIGDTEKEASVEGYVNFVVNVYHAFARGADSCTWHVEQKVKVSDECYGTADFVAVRTIDGVTEIMVIDLKTGYHYVEVIDNEQLAIYTVGAKKLNKANGAGYSFIYSSRVPGLDKPYKRWEMPVKTLEEWEDKINTSMTEAMSMYKGEKESTFCSGDHCKWCRVEGICATRQAALEKETDLLLTENPYQVEGIEKGKLAPTTFSIERLAKILDHKDQILSLLDEAEKVGKQLLESGTDVPGWAIALTKTRRKWNGDDFTERQIARELEDLGLDEPYVKKLMNFTDVEKKIGKGQIDHLLGKTTPSKKLVRDKDNRNKIAVDSLIKPV